MVSAVRGDNALPDKKLFDYIEEVMRTDPDLAMRAIHSSPILTQFWEAHRGFYYTFKPRPDNLAMGDQQTSFFESRDFLAFFIGGNAAGTTLCSLMKAAKFLLEQQAPPRKDTAFWIISNSYEVAITNAWKDKIVAQGIIPPCEIEWSRISWHNQKDGTPAKVPLKPWPKERGGEPDKNWVIEFKSYEQGREHFQARAIGGFLFMEQFPFELLIEVLRGCRDYNFPGSKICEFTPLDPFLSAPIEDMILNNTMPPEWHVYWANTECNTALAEGWLENFTATFDEDQRATRLRGQFGSFTGLVYPSFQQTWHVKQLERTIDGFVRFPKNVHHVRAIDWGGSEEHPFVCLWAYRDGMGRYVVYDEYWNNSQFSDGIEHIERIKSRHPWPSDPWHGATYGDPSRPDMINLFSRFGIPVNPGRNDREPGIDAVKRKLAIHPGMREPMLLIDKENCPHLVKEFRMYRRLRSKVGGLNPNVARNDVVKRDDDCLDALRYMIYSEEMVGGNGGFQGMRVTNDPRRHGIPLVTRNGIGHRGGRTGRGR